ncbi:zf-HC2 domain-containing protein [Streptomyces sp. MP131-18]|uniref:anti-sigma factor family protein n=1 Tax=Streptomyces sp. MP131-18 TaxID=1857892 RepID=UPI00097C0634|nr:zf-HC2 domain-containing protein [Streptomyces sp. MP131-18]ONK12684.1 putative transmembrane transcriptional regulator(anti-sigma factor) [Streptomyces sp. MP131-18]
MSGDSFRTFDGAYVLGALAPQERAAFEEHMRTCESCARAVRELAGLPGLLAQTESAAGRPPPPELLPGLLARVAAARRRRRLLTGISAAAVALAACVALVFTLLGGGGAAEEPESAMTPVGRYPVSATVGLVDAEGGMRVEMECQYGGDRGGDYLLVAVAPDGTVAELASWHALPQDTAYLTVGTPLRRADIASLEVRTPSGLTVLRLTLGS